MSMSPTVKLWAAAQKKRKLEIITSEFPDFDLTQAMVETLQAEDESKLNGKPKTVKLLYKILAATNNPMRPAALMAEFNGLRCGYEIGDAALQIAIRKMRDACLIVHKNRGGRDGLILSRFNNADNWVTFEHWALDDKLKTMGYTILDNFRFEKEQPTKIEPVMVDPVAAMEQAVKSVADQLNAACVEFNKLSDMLKAVTAERDELREEVKKLETLRAAIKGVM